MSVILTPIAEEIKDIPNPEADIQDIQEIQDIPKEIPKDIQDIPETKRGRGRPSGAKKQNQRNTNAANPATNPATNPANTRTATTNPTAPSANESIGTVATATLDFRRAPPREASVLCKDARTFNVIHKCLPSRLPHTTCCAIV